MDVPLSKDELLDVWYTNSVLNASPTQQGVHISLLDPTLTKNVMTFQASAGIFGADSAVSDPRTFDLYLDSTKAALIFK